jgi:hypothetical protein
MITGSVIILIGDIVKQGTGKFSKQLQDTK